MLRKGDFVVDMAISLPHQRASNLRDTDMQTFEITPEFVTKLLSVIDAGLVTGVGQPVPGRMCVEAAVCYTMNLPHGDEPTCVAPAIRSMKIALNDSAWGDNKSRAKGLRRLAVLQLGTKDNFDNVTFAKRLALATIKTILPIALSAAGLHEHSHACSIAINLPAAANAANAAARAAYGAYAAARAAYAADAAARAAYAAADAAYAAANAAAYAADAAARAANAASAAANAAAYAARAAAYAARAAADAADKNSILFKFAKIAEDILIDMNVPGVAFLDMLED
jgi:hypothetical protein